MELRAQVSSITVAPSVSSLAVQHLAATQWFLLLGLLEALVEVQVGREHLQMVPEALEQLANDLAVAVEGFQALEFLLDLDSMGNQALEMSTAEDQGREGTAGTALELQALVGTE